MQKRQLHQAPTFGGRRRRRRSSSGWSSLSADLVVLLLQRLNLQDYVRSGAVCRWWNTIVSSKPCPPAPNLMWEYMDPKDVHHQPSSGTNNNTLTFYCPTEKRFYNFPSPCGAVLVTELCFGNYRGWLLMATATGCPPDSQRRHILYNPISGAQVKNIPPLPENTFNITVMQLQPFVVVAGWEDLKENRGGAVRIWRSSCCRDEESAGWSQILHDKSPDFWYESIISYKGSLYAVTNAAELRLIEFINNPHQDYSPQVRTVIGPLFTTTVTSLNLVESTSLNLVESTDHELLLVHNPFPEGNIQVRKANLRSREWELVQSLGTNQIMFLCFQLPICVSVRDLPPPSVFKFEYCGNCIYFQSKDGRPVKYMLEKKKFFDRDIIKSGCDDHISFPTYLVPELP